METATDTLLSGIRVELARRKMTQDDLARGLGVNQHWVSRRMTGRTEWTISEVESVSEFLGVPFLHLFGHPVTP